MHRRVNIRRIVLLVMTIVMFITFGSGIYSFFTAPAKAKEAQEEVERELKKKQEKQNQRLKEQADNSRDKEKINEAVSQMQEQLQNNETINLHDQYTDASQLHITGIGDSVMLAASDALYQMFPNSVFDTRFGRSIDEGEQILEQKEAAGELGDCVFLSLITNMSLNVTEDKVENLIAHCDGRPVFFTTTYGIDPTSNGIMKSVVARHKNVYIIDCKWFRCEGRHKA